PTHPDATPTRASAPVDRPVPGLAGEVVEPVVGRVLAHPAEAGPPGAADAAAGPGEVDSQANLVHRVARPCRRRRALPGGHVPDRVVRGPAVGGGRGGVGCAPPGGAAAPAPRRGSPR